MRKDYLVFAALMLVLVAVNAGIIVWANSQTQGGVIMGHTWSSGEKITSTKLNEGTVSDVTASRASETIYQNTGGRMLLVIATYSFNKAAALDNCYAQARVQNVTPPITQAADAGFHGQAGASVQYLFGVLSFVVPNNYYYRIMETESGASVVTKIKWYEIQL